jgi:hypothetical protein
VAELKNPATFEQKIEKKIEDSIAQKLTQKIEDKITTKLLASEPEYQESSKHQNTESTLPNR